MKNDIHCTISNKTVCVVGGLGHVGLPLAISLADKGMKVTIYDIDPIKTKIVSDGQMPFLEEGAEPVLKRVIGKTLFISSDKSCIPDHHFIIIVIGTPVDEHLNPQFTVFKKFFEGILDVIRDGQHIILRSTVYPGTTEKVKKLLEAHGKKTKVSFCPERIAQGQAMRELHTLPQIIGAFEETSSQEAQALFNQLTEDTVMLKPFEAELSKLFTNVWRYIQFGIANQFYQIATQNGLDWHKIYESITYKYPRAQSFPGAGFAAGPCLFKDTMQLAAFSNNNFFLGHAAMLINEGLPNFIIQRLKERIHLSEQSVGILGMSFKANNDDKRESLSYKLKKLLLIESKRVHCSDVYLKEDGFISPEELIQNSDVIILGSPHREYKNLIIPQNKTLVDIWNFFGKGGSC